MLNRVGFIRQARYSKLSAPCRSRNMPLTMRIPTGCATSSVCCPEVVAGTKLQDPCSGWEGTGHQINEFVDIVIEVTIS